MLICLCKENTKILEKQSDKVTISLRDQSFTDLLCGPCRKTFAFIIIYNLHVYPSVSFPRIGERGVCIALVFWFPWNVGESLFPRFCLSTGNPGSLFVSRMGFIT